MDTHLRTFLEELYREGREYDAGRPDRLDRRRNLEPDSAELLAVLVRSVRPTKLLELGTSNGYSTVWLADAALAVDADLTTVDIDGERLKQAKDNLRTVGLVEIVHFLHGDAGEILARSESGSLDMIFLDAERPHYSDYWEDLVRVLTPGGLLVVDNVTSHAEQVAPFREIVDHDGRVTTALAPTGAGMLLVVKALTLPRA